ncbi:MAG TPA: hypothetical protein VGK67_23340 [Myxococcales bacterium]|jgi:predicted small secreted protein
MRTRLLPLLFALAALAVAGCKTVEVKPTGAGSTAVLRLMRDWRGVWAGAVRESPMGAMNYTLYVEPKDDHLLMVSAPIREAGLDSIKHEYRLFRFDKGMPRIEFTLTQRGRTDEGRLAYQEDASTEEDAIFCPEEGTCDKLRMTFTMVSDKVVAFKTLVDEAPHSQFTLTFVSKDIPKNHGEWLEKPPPPPGLGGESTKSTKPKPKLDADGNPLDQDLVLKENVDEDAGTAKKKKKEKEEQEKKKGADEGW